LVVGTPDKLWRAARCHLSTELRAEAPGILSGSSHHSATTAASMACRVLPWCCHHAGNTVAEWHVGRGPPSRKQRARRRGVRTILLRGTQAAVTGTGCLHLGNAVAVPRPSGSCPRQSDCTLAPSHSAALHGCSACEACSTMVHQQPAPSVHGTGHSKPAHAQLQPLVVFIFRPLHAQPKALAEHNQWRPELRCSRVPLLHHTDPPRAPLPHFSCPTRSQRPRDCWGIYGQEQEQESVLKH
jgi:hypothetical protein